MSTPLDYTCGIKVTFDKEIISNPEIVSGSTSNVRRAVFVPLSSGAYSSTYDEAKAFDSLDNTYWRSSGANPPAWLGADLGGVVNVTKVRVHTGSIYRPKTYVVEGSDDAVSWDAVHTGDLLNATGWQEITFAGASYRYWRVYFSAGYATYFAVRDMEFYGTNVMYSPNGFAVSGNIYESSPEGESAPHSFTIRRVTKTEDNLSIIIWLEITDRLKYPVSTITVSYDKATGNLLGALNAQVDSFSESFTPQNVTLLFSPSNADHISLGLTQDLDLMEIFYSFFQKSDEAVTVGLSQSNEIIHIDDIEQ